MQSEIDVLFSQITMHPHMIQIASCLQRGKSLCFFVLEAFADFLFLKIFTLTFLDFAFLTCLFLFQEKKGLIIRITYQEIID